VTGEHGDEDEEGREEDRGAKDRPAARKLAEWVTMGLSVLVVAGVAGVLGYQATREKHAFVPAEMTPLLEEVREVNGQYILPLEVKNRGRRTLHGFKARVTSHPAQGPPEEREFEIDYLGEGATQKTYLYFDRHPRDLRVRAQPLGYRLE
jgi:uncharacterized protein (TIGR02588 family)